jgi:ADP-ribosylglycohydrolase
MANHDDTLREEDAMNDISRAERITGAMWGVLVGDAVGVPYEFREPGEVGEVVFGAKGSHRQPPGTWSDDGALTLALADSLSSAGFDLDDQGRRFLAWKQDGAYTPDGRVFDFGITTAAALDAIRRGLPAATAGPSGERDCGNGSLMRIAPLAAASGGLAPGEVVRRAHAASAVTHGHPRCQTACAVYCLLLAGLLDGASLDEALDEALDAYGRVLSATGEVPYGPHATALTELVREARKPPRGSGFVLDAFWCAVGAVRGTSDYAGAVRAAVSLGHDTDTTAAIAGGLAGALYGLRGIPDAWLRGMRGGDVAGPVINRLAATARGAA